MLIITLVISKNKFQIQYLIILTQFALHKFFCNLSQKSYRAVIYIFPSAYLHIFQFEHKLKCVLINVKKKIMDTIVSCHDLQYYRNEMGHFVRHPATSTT